MKKFLIGKAISNAASYEIQAYDTLGNNKIGDSIPYTPELGADIKCDLTDKYQENNNLIVGTEYKIKCKAKPASDEVLYVESAWSVGQPFQLYETLKIKGLTVEITDLKQDTSVVTYLNGIEVSEHETYNISPPLVLSFFRIGTIEEGEALDPLNFKENTTLEFESLGKATVKDNTLIFNEIKYAQAYSLAQNKISITISYNSFNITES